MSALVLFGVSALLATGIILSGLDDFDVSGFETRDLTVEHSGAAVAGTLYLPVETDPPLVLLVAGDGPSDRTFGEAMVPLIKTFLENGIAVYAWDKPGVGASEGNWLDYTMADRADLAATTLSHVQNLPEFKNSRTGFVGFSQAGWVLPYLAAEKGPADFYVLIGSAVNWQRQGNYYTQVRLTSEGKSDEEINKVLEGRAARDARWADPTFSYRDFLKTEPSPGPDMNADRFEFLRRNMTADSSALLSAASAPFLIVHGQNDLNVDPHDNQQRYRALIGDNHPANRLIMIDNATHGLLDAGLFNYQLSSEMPVWRTYAFMALGREAYAPGALETLTSWINQQASVPLRSN